MSQRTFQFRKTLLTAAAAAGLSAILAVGFAGWLTQGPDLFLAMAETGLSWCF